MSQKGLQKPPSSSSALTDFDQIFDFIGHYGPYQLFMLVVIQYIMLNSAGNYIFISFATLKPTCHSSQLDSSSSNHSAHMAEMDGCRSVATCPPANRTSVFHSLYEEEDFVCPQHPYLPHHMQTLQAIGSGVGAVVGGHAADMWGRKWITQLGAFSMCTFGLLGALSLDWHWLALCMFGMGLAYGVLIDSSMTLASETVGPRYRIVQTLAFQWSLAMQLAALIAYLTADWRRYLLVLNGVCTPVLVLMLFWLESPRWLIQKRRHEEACTALNAIARWNRCEKRFKPADLAGIQLNSQGHHEDGKYAQDGEISEFTGRMERVYTLWDLFSTRKLALYSFVMIVSALTVETSVAVIIFDVQILAGSPFWNVALYGLLRIWVPFFIVMMERRNEWFGRRLLYISSQTITAACFAGVLVLIYLRAQSPMHHYNELLAVLRTALLLIGGVVNSSFFFTIYKQYSIELYPTVMRAIAVGCFGVMERVGGALAPQLITLNSIGWEGTALSVATVMVLASLISGYLILPETKNASMPDVHLRDTRKEKRDAIAH